MVRLVLATAVTAALAACYSPQYADCTNTCNASHLCPDGLSCSEGFCRAEGATGACVDADTTADAAPDARTTCPANPETSTGCSPVGQSPVPPFCITMCAATVASTALSYQRPLWHVLIVDSDGEEASASAIAAAGPGGASWLGLSQPTDQPMPPDGWQWPMNMPPSVIFHWAPLPTTQPDDGDGTENNAQNCATVGAGGWSDEDCNAMHPFLVEPNSSSMP